MSSLGVVLSTTLLVVLLCPQFYTCRSNGELKDDYELMPPLFGYENMTNCFERYRGSLYCVVKTVVNPDKHSEVWRAIEKYSKHPSYHEHSLLDRGLCVEDCVSLVASLDSTVAEMLDTERVTIEPYHLLSLPSEKDLPQRQVQYGRILNICANYHLQERYNLSGYSELERCVMSETLRSSLDVYHFVFLFIAFLLIATATVATVADVRTVFRRNNATNPKRDPEGLWMEFSLRRSWSRLVVKPQSALQRNFAFVEMFRMLSMFIILVIHVTMCYTAAPTANMRPLEEFYGLPMSLAAVSVFPFQVHTFFTIGGVLLAVHFLDQAKVKGRIGWSFLLKGIVLRYFRVFPVLFVIWMYHTSWFDQFALGPGDYRYFQLERDNCRENGWLNFLFLNNYFKFNNMCMQNTWHLAADFQFFLVGLPFLILINRHPRMLWPLVITMATFSVGAPIVNLFHHRLPGVILTNFKQLRFVFYHHRTLENDYMLAHPHTGSYFSGLFAGLAYHRYQASPIPLLERGKGAWILKWVPPAMVTLQAALSPLFYGLDYSKPLLWNAIYGAVHRCSWDVMCAVGILIGATKWQGRHSWIHLHPVVLVLSRLSFGVFMVQFSVLKYLTRNATGAGVEFNWMIFIESVIYSVVICYAAALALALMVELPAAAIFKRLFGPKRLQVSNGTKHSGVKDE